MSRHVLARSCYGPGAFVENGIIYLNQLECEGPSCKDDDVFELSILQHLFERRTHLSSPK
jgi:hypothetical protein